MGDQECSQGIRGTSTGNLALMTGAVRTYLLDPDSSHGLKKLAREHLSLRMTEIDPGTVVRLKDSNAPYGTILRFDPAHKFHTGDPAPAYEIHLRSGDETVWLSKRVVVKGMVPVKPARPVKR